MESDSLLRTDKGFASVYQRNINRVYQICCLYLRNRSDAEDAAQCVFEKYIGLNQCFTDENHEKAWFITVSKNYCKDQLKKLWKRKRVDIESLEEFAACAQDTRGGELTATLMRLPVKYQESIYLYYIEGYSVKEISKMLHRNESTLRNHLSEGRKLLKIDLGGYYEE